MYITRSDLHSAMRTYKRLVGKMPAELQDNFPVFDHFIRFLPITNALADCAYVDKPSIQRFEILQSPHAETLLRVWAIKNEEK